MRSILPVALVLLLLSAAASAQDGDDTVDQLRAFMEEVIKKRDDNWMSRYNFVFTEHEEFTIEGNIMEAPLENFSFDYTWYVKDGYLVRSPVRRNGAAVSEEEQEKYEEQFIKQRKRGRSKGPETDEERFFGFDFEDGIFAVVGREELDGMQTTVVEYYPDITLTEKDIEGMRHDHEYDDAIDNSFTVRLWVLPEQRQIVQMTVMNSGMPYLPGSWLARVEGFSATMRMHQPVEGVWLVKEYQGEGRVATASEDIQVRYHRVFDNYQRASVNVKYRFPAPEAEREEQ